MEFALWTRAAVGQLIEVEFRIKLSVRGVGKYLKRWGFTPQKPIRRAYEQSPEAVKKWLDEDYPAIAAKAKAEGGEITGAMRQRWSTRRFTAAAMLRRERRLSRWRRARGRNCR